MPLRPAFAVLCLAAPAAAAVCVENGADERRLFVAEAGGGPRMVGWLDPGGTLCSDGAGGGTVSVFESPEHFEGCSRLVPQGETETLIRYSDFDRCHWSSHDR